MSSKDEKYLQQVIDKIASMDEPRRSVMHQLHDADRHDKNQSVGHPLVHTSFARERSSRVIHSPG